VLIPRHAPPSRVHRRRTLQPPEAQATTVLGSRCVAGTRLRACCSSARVLATFHLFWPCTVLDGVYGGRSSGGWYRWRRVSSTRRRLRRILPLSHCRQLLWVFSVFCVHSHVSTVDHSLSICNAQMFMGLFGVWGRLGQSSYVDCMGFNCKEVIYLGSL
jgi:hypothetical protein